MIYCDHGARIHDHHPPQHSLHLVWLPSLCGAWSFRGPEIFWPRDRRLGELVHLIMGLMATTKLGWIEMLLGDKNILALRAVLGWCQHLLLMMRLWRVWWQIYIEHWGRDDILYLPHKSILEIQFPTTQSQTQSCFRNYLSQVGLEWSLNRALIFDTECAMCIVHIEWKKFNFKISFEQFSQFNPAQKPKAQKIMIDLSILESGSTVLAFGNFFGI